MQQALPSGLGFGLSSFTTQASFGQPTGPLLHNDHQSLLRKTNPYRTGAVTPASQQPSTNPNLNQNSFNLSCVNDFGAFKPPEQTPSKRSKVCEETNQGPLPRPDAATYRLDAEQLPTPSAHPTPFDSKEGYCDFLGLVEFEDDDAEGDVENFDHDAGIEEAPF